MKLGPKPKRATGEKPMQDWDEGMCRGSQILEERFIAQGGTLSLRLIAFARSFNWRSRDLFAVDRLCSDLL